MVRTEKMMQNDKAAVAEAAAVAETAAETGFLHINSK